MHTNHPPDPRFQLGSVMPTSGVPDNKFGNDGSISVDQDTGATYVKFSGAWVDLPTILGSLSASNRTGTGSPEGAVTAPVGTAYFDTAADSLWYKKTGSGNTGWVQLFA